MLKKLQGLKNLLDPKRHYRFMEFCGGHTHAFFRYGFPTILPCNLEMIHGPGCPVCVLPAERIAAIIQLLLHNPNLVLYSYGDLMRVPGEKGEGLLQAKARGAAIRMIYDHLDLLEFCQSEPDKTHIFFAIGFETTAPTTALLLQKALTSQVSNLLVYCNHVLTPPAACALLNDEDGPPPLDGIIGPGHVCSVTGPDAFDCLARDFKIPVAVSGFFPLDLLMALENLVMQTHNKTATVVNTYKRSVKSSGNQLAQAAVKDVFSLRENFSWRGLGNIPKSALQISKKFEQFDLEKKFELPMIKIQDHPKCLCPQILKGQKKPLDCTLFGKVCRPENPIGACMVSGEGSCAAYFGFNPGGQHV